MFDVLSFGDGRLTVASKETPVRELTVNGIAFRTLLDAVSSIRPGPISPITAQWEGRRRNLRGLLGEEQTEQVRDGRVVLAVCPSCFDASCGMLIAGSLAIGPRYASWSSIGLEHEHPGTLVKRFHGLLGRFRADVIAPEEWWTPSAFAPEWGFKFDREQYFSEIAAELDRFEKTSVPTESPAKLLRKRGRA